MIIGIDEVGDFNPTSTKFNYFVAVLIDQNRDKYLIKKRLFEQWESTIPQIYRSKDNEVKGQLLIETQLEAFYNTVLSSEPASPCVVVRIIPVQISKAYIDKVRDHILDEIDKQISEFLKMGNPPILNDYQKIRGWYKNRNYNNVLKILCTERVLSLAFRYSVGFGQLTYMFDSEDISNLKNVKFLIDKDFVRAPRGA